MKISHLAASLALWSLAASAQSFVYENLTLPPSTTTIDWNGKPALLIVVSAEQAVATFLAPTFWPPETRPRNMRLPIWALGLWDARPCAANALFTFCASDCSTPSIPLNGQIHISTWSGTQWEMTWLNGCGGVQPWKAEYCGPGGKSTTACGQLVCQPQGLLAVVCTIAW